MTDLKNTNSRSAKRYSMAENYPEIAKSAIFEMYRQRGKAKLDSNGIMESGVIVRHLLMPDGVEDCLDILDFFTENFGKFDVFFSLMSQFTPINTGDFSEINRLITAEEYQRAVSYFEFSGIENGYIQELEATGTQEIPNFDFSGLQKNS